MGCERGRVHRKKKENCATNKRECGTRKCNFPFPLWGVNIDGDRWKLEVR